MRGLDTAGCQPIFLSAAHNAVRAADESSAMNETNVHVVITDVRWSDPAHASSVVNVPSRAGLARFRAVALSQRCSFVNGATRSLVCGVKWLPNLFRKGEGPARAQVRQLAHSSHRSRDDGTESSSGRINWGPSAGLEALRDISHETRSDQQKRGCGHSKRGGWRTR
jgi:hypothetical protein